MEQAVAFGPHYMALDQELLRVLTAGDTARLEELLRREEERALSHVAVNVHQAVAAPAGGVAAAPPWQQEASRLLGVTSNGNTALHLAASRGHAELAALICERAPSLAATRNRCLDTPLHCAARAGSREAAACLMSAMRGGGAQQEMAAALRERNCMGATALFEAVRHRRAGVVDLLMAEAPELASVTTDDGVSLLYLAASAADRTSVIYTSLGYRSSLGNLGCTRPESLQMVRALLRPSLDGTPSAASFSGPEGRTAVHAAASCSKEIAQEILGWKPDGPNLLTRVDSTGRTPLYFAALCGRPDAVEMFLESHASDEAVRISNNHGLFPVHAAAMGGNTRIVDALINKCPDYYELVDDGGRNFLHCAVQHNQETVVRHICRNDKFGMLLNATDTQGNTPLHLAAKHGYPRIAILLLQKTSVETGIMNKDGLTALDVACKELKPGLTYFLNPQVVVFNCLNWSRAPHTTGGVNINVGGNPSEDEAPNEDDDDPSKTGTIASVLIATVAFAAAFTLPGGLVADDHPGAGTAVLARRFAFRAFVVSDTMAFLCSILATSFLIYAARRVPLSHRYWYNILASRLVPMGEQFTIAAFAFGFHLALGDANRGLVVFVYAACLATELFCFPGIWISMHLGLAKAIWRQAGWRGLANVHEGSSSLLESFRLFATSLVYGHLERLVFVVLISATFIVAIALNFALPNY